MKDAQLLIDYEFPGYGMVKPGGMHRAPSHVSHPRAIALFCALVASPLAVRGVAANAPPPLEIAVTIDDVPWNGPLPAPDSLREMTASLVRTLRQFDAPVAVFVSCRDDASTAATVRMWDEAGATIGNHVAGHIGVQHAAPHAWANAVRRCDRSLRSAMRAPPRFFRYPMLQEPVSSAQRDTARAVFSELGYRVARVTIDNSDYLLARPYDAVRGARDSAAMREIGQAMIAHDLDATQHFEAAAERRVGRGVRHILLLHANRMTVDYLPDLLARLKQRGARFISLEEALRDPIYQLPDSYGGKRGFSWIYRVPSSSRGSAVSDTTWDEAAAAGLEKIIARVTARRR